ncbi:squalene monooxygenase erg1 [Grosmannia clavigera kw1407]|uniref:Squalene monooxygenase n=1 Tax=Grosmannia clavigera (strain kw1407 / UAMH 11150) TaxID=655863 RepID=F0XTV3_GROCL|nr:squalene monooxygenase erg1 [Grosmannia clavigera kw1407]EFW98636.1 squalene monooxygenase erg1 [Grosmannia clavigera kw1407]
MADPALLRRTADHQADVVVVGAGVFGAAIATALARQQRSVILLERSLKEPERIVGELLQPGGVRALEQLGLQDCLEGIDAVPVHGYEVIYNHQSVSIPYPVVDGAQPGSKPAEGRAFHHGRFIQKLRAAAAAEKNITIVETEVNGLIRSETSDQVLGVTAKTDGKADYYFGALTIVADGYRSKFREENAGRKPTSKSKFWALELVDAALPAPKHGHVVLNQEHSPVLLYQIGTHETRALVNVPDGLAEAKPAQGGVPEYMRRVVLPQLPPSVQGSFSKSLEAGRLRCMPNSFLPATPNQVPGLVLGGDALNMRHPLTGGGMTVALNDIVVLRDLLAPALVPSLADVPLVLRQLQTFHWQRKRLSAVINILAQALYSLFDADDYYLNALRNGCFAYFQRGGNCIRGPVQLLAGVTHRPQALVYHFTSVALLSIWVLLYSNPLWRLPLTLFECVAVLYKASVVILPFILVEFW